MKTTAIERHSLERVMRNLNKQIKKMHGTSIKGLIRASIIVRRAMDKEPPLIPVDMGNLRASWFTVTKNGAAAGDPSFQGDTQAQMSGEHMAVVAEAGMLASSASMPTLVMGFSANYAFFVHEMIEAEFKRPGSGAKFLEAALRNKQQEIVRAIAQEVSFR